MKIYNGSGEVILDVIVDDNSYRNRAIMGDHSVVLYFALPTFTEIPVGAYIDYQGERYTLERPEALKMKHSRNFEYTVTLEAYQTRAERWKFINPVDGRISFPLTAKPVEHLQMFVDNMNRRDTGWSVGDCVDGVEKDISYDKFSCLEALQQMATKFDTEYEIVGKTVSLHKVEYNKTAPLTLSYGKGNGFLPNIGRSNSGDNLPVEILYVEGGSDNIDPSAYGNSSLLLPKSQTLRFDGSHFEDEEGFDSSTARGYLTSADGFSLRRSDKELSSQAEDCLDCTNIYPQRTGTVGAVVVVDAENHFYDFTDSDPASDPCPNYEDYLIDGETMTVIFQSGMLAGRELEVKYIHNAVTEKGVAKLPRRFELVPQEIDGETMPNDTYKPAVGDTYIVFHCAMPQEYISDDASRSGASWQMFRTAVRYFYENEDAKFTFTGTLDGIWAKKDWLNIGGKILLGGYVQFTDERFQKEPALVRITGVKDYINKPHSPEVTLSNETIAGGLSSTVKTLEAQEVVIDDNYSKSLQFTKRRFRDAQETAKMIEEAMLTNYTSAVSPITVRTMSLLVGDESLQFRFVDNRTNPKTVAHSVTYDGDTMKLSADAGFIQHLTLGINSLSSSHKVSEYKFWSVEAYTSPVLTDTAVGYYLYIKAERDSETATFLLSPTAVGMTDEADYYYFLVGILNSEYNGERNFVSLYGYSEVLPGRVTTDRVVSGDGDSYFDMVADAMKLGDALDFNSQGDGKLRLKGTLVQNQGGAESPIGVNRGEYNASYTYYNGDEVAYTVGGVTSTYRYINANASAGHAPTETAYWAVQAAGVKGDKGDDGKNAYSPYIGTNGNWYFYNDTTQQYEDSGRSATGDDGHSPYVGDNGNWFEYNAETGAYEDTGVHAKGDKGDKGDKGADGANGKDGADGADGKPSYLHIKYSDDGGHTFTQEIGTRLLTASALRFTSGGGLRLIGGGVGELAGAWIGTYTDDNPEDSLYPSDYKWAKVKGAVGDYYEYRYAKNGSPTVPPSITTTERTPDGWDTAVPSVGELEYLWAVIAKISGDSDTLLQNWSTPVRFSPQDGAKGDKGDSPALVFRGEYSADTAYYGNAYRVDCVKYEDAYYVARIDAGTITGVAPTDTSKWNTFGATFDSIATGLLLAENANIAGWIFRNGRLESQTTDSSDDPMAFLDGTKGEVRLKGTIQHSTATKGNFSDVDIFTLPARTDGFVMSMGTEKEDIGKRCVLMNNSTAGSGGYYKIKVQPFGWSGNMHVSGSSEYYLISPQEAVEMTCFELAAGTVLPGFESYPLTNGGGYWKITNRFHKDMPPMIAMGRIFNSTSGATIVGQSPFGTDFTVSRNGTSYTDGLYTITLPSFFKNVYNPIVMLTGYGYTQGSTTAPVKATLISISGQTMVVAVSDDASMNGGSFAFVIYAYGGYSV